MSNMTELAFITETMQPRQQTDIVGKWTSSHLPIIQFSNHHHFYIYQFCIFYDFHFSMTCNSFYCCLDMLCILILIFVHTYMYFRDKWRFKANYSREKLNLLICYLLNLFLAQSVIQRYFFFGMTMLLDLKLFDCSLCSSKQSLPNSQNRSAFLLISSTLNCPNIYFLSN